MTIILFCGLAVLSSICSVLWKNHLRDVHERQTTLLAQAATIEELNKYSEAIPLYEKAEEDGGSLAALAGLRHAHALIATKQVDKAIALYGEIAEGKLGNGPASLREYARLEGAILAQNQPGGKAVAVPDEGIYSDSATELNALNALKAGDKKMAANLFSSVLSDEAGAMSQRMRAALFLEPIKEPRK